MTSGQGQALPGPGFFLLESQPHGKLNDSWTAAHQAGGGADRGSHGAPDRRGDLAEISTARVGYRVREVGVIEKIEEISTELEPEPFGAESEILRRCEIVVGQPRTVILVAAGGSDPPRGRRLGVIAGVKRGVWIPIVLD